MDFRLTDEQSALRTSARALLTAECPADLARARYDDVAAVPDRLSAALREQGWLRLLVPEEYGGLGLGVVELCLVLEEAGRALVPAPLWSTAGLFVPLVCAAGDGDRRADLLQRVSSDDLLGTAAIAEEDGRWTLTPASTTATADGDQWRISGLKRLVPEADRAAVLVVSAQTNDGPDLFVVDREAVAVRWLETVDRSRALYDVTFDDAPAYRLNADSTGATRALDIATVALAAELLGTARWILDTTVAYTKVREQFNVPIGSFQAVQHMCADDLLDWERAWAATYWAAMCLDADDEAAPRATSVAKASAGDAARHIAKDGIQLHGGIGYTWEHDLHLYIRRTYAAESLLGGAEEQRQRLADLLAL
jgi:alkylation response protein AidB-like acyl-CoA dehydrogenase